MNQMGFSLTFSIVIIVAALLIGGSFYLYMAKNAPINSMDATKTVRSDWIKYRNEELGFQFSYPEKWGERVNPSVWGSESEFAPEVGLYLIIQNIYFPSNDFSAVAYPREYCPEGDDYRMTIGQGHVFKNGEYFSRWCNDRELTQIKSSTEQRFVVKKIVNTVNTEAVMWVDDSPFSGDTLIKASVNLQKDMFPGVGFAMVWKPTVVFNKEEGAVDAPVSFEELLAEFESVIKSVELIK